MKSKWVTALKHIKGKQDMVQAGQTPIIENCHVFLENTYKKITPCDVCSQVLRGELLQQTCKKSGKFKLCSLSF